MKSDGCVLVIKAREIVINFVFFASKCHKRAAKDERTKRKREDCEASKDGGIIMAG